MKKNLIKIAVLLLVCSSFCVNAMAQSHRGYEKSLEFSGLFEAREKLIVDNVSALNLTFVNGYRHNDYLFIGAGIGVDYSMWESLSYYSNIYKDYSVSIPLFARLKVNLMKTKVSPYISFDLGYNFMIGSSDDYSFRGIKNEYAYKRSGLIMSPTVGAEFKLTEDQSIYLGLSYLLNAFFENDHSYGHNMNSVGFRLGYIF